MDFRESRVGCGRWSPQAALAWLLGVILALGSSNGGRAGVIFDNAPAPLPANIPSVGDASGYEHPITPTV